MIKWAATLFLFSAALVSSAQLPLSGLVAYYTFNNNVSDESGYRNNGNTIGNVQRATDRFGNPCGALRFDGVSGYIAVPNSASLQSPRNSISITAWVKPEATTSGNTDKWITLICKGHNPVETPFNPAYRFQVFQGNSQSTVSINTEFTEFDLLYKSHPFSFDQWHFLTLVYDGMYVSMYTNGLLMFQFPYTGMLVNNNEPLEIGRDIPGSTEFFRGCIDDLRIYNRPLTDSEIQLLLKDRSGAQYTDGFELIMPANIERKTEPGQCYASVAFSEPTTLSVCGNAQVVQVTGQPSGSRFEAGVWPVRFVATNEAGRKQSCSFDVIVRDAAPPVLKCPADIHVTCTTGSSKARVTYTAPVGNDNCPGVKTERTSGPESGSYLPVGTHSIAYKAIDATGHVSSCTFKVMVSPAADSPKASPAVVSKNDTAPAIIAPPVSPKNIAGDSVRYAAGVSKTENCEVTLLIYDSGLEDNDTVSIIFNDKILADYVMLRSRKANTLDNIIKARVAMENGKPNYLVVKAWNTGKTWPNTVTVDIYYGDINTESDMGSKRALRKVIEATPGVSGGVVFTCGN